MKQLNLVLIVFLASFIASFGQEKYSYSPEIYDLGDCQIIGSEMHETEEFTIQEFVVEVEEGGEFFIAAWVNNGGLDLDGNFIEYLVQINNEGPEYIIYPTLEYSQAIVLEDQPVTLQPGQNTIRFKTKKPACPNVEFIKASLTYEYPMISSEMYDTYIYDISQYELPDDYYDIKQSAKDDELFKSNLKYKLANPLGNYEHEMELDFGYSYYRYVYLFAGYSYTIETMNATSDPVLQLFSYFSPSQYSWTDDDGGIGYNSRITLTAPYTGYYMLLIRKYYNPSSVVGKCDLVGNGWLLARNCAISGSGIRCDKTISQSSNWFTADLSGDSRIWIEDRNGFPGRIISYNDDWNVSSDFYWGWNSRVKSNLNTNIRATIVSCYSSYNPTGNCDLYMNCLNSNIMSWFPNLKADDAIQSAPASGVYNCISWSGGITNYWHWPPSPMDPYYDPAGPLASFDNFYASKRYYGAMTYSRTGATYSNSVVDLWAYSGSYTHASVRKPGNYHPHGYDWESKPGSLMRTFHPRHSLYGSSYGQVNKYYKSTSKSGIILDESIALGYSVIENVEFTDNERSIISSSIASLPNTQRKELESKFYKWEQTWDRPEAAAYSDPRMFAQNKEYDDFIDYCNSRGESVWSFIFDKFQQDDFFVINALEDLTLKENQDVLEKVKTESSLEPTTENGEVIVRTIRTIAMKYIKELLKSSNVVLHDEDDGIIYSNSFDFNVFPVPANETCRLSFTLPTEAKVSAQVIDVNGKVLSIVIDEKVLAAGKQSYLLNIPGNYKGVCLVKLLINNNVNVKSIVVE